MKSAPKLPLASEAVLMLTFPGHVPDMRLSPNRRLHWATRHAWTQRERAFWGWMFKEQIILGPLPLNDPPYELLWEVRFKTRTNRDADNVLAVLKAAQDGAIDAGLFPDDRNQYIAQARASVVLGSKEPGTTLTISKIEVSA